VRDLSNCALIAHLRIDLESEKIVSLGLYPNSRAVRIAIASTQYEETKPALICFGDRSIIRYHCKISILQVFYDPSMKRHMDELISSLNNLKKVTSAPYLCLSKNFLSSKFISGRKSKVSNDFERHNGPSREDSAF